MNYQLSTNGLSFLGKEEGLRLSPYLDSKGIPTIAIGCTYYEDGTRVKMSDPSITQARALLLTINVLKSFQDAINFCCHEGITQNEFDALVSMCYNIGIAAFKKSMLLTYINSNSADSQTIIKGFTGWTMKGILLPRRLRESALYLGININDCINIYKSEGGVLTSEQLEHLTNF